MRFLKLAGAAVACLAWLFVSEAMGQYPEGQVVKQIRVEGNKLVSTQLIMSQVRLQLDKPFSWRIVQQDERAVFALKRFSDVKVDVVDTEGGVTVVYAVTEKKLIDSVEIIGNRRLRTSAIQEVLKLGPGDTYWSRSFEKEQESILKLYEKKGFPAATVSAEVREISDTKAKVAYIIDEGTKARIRDVRVSGASALSQKEILKAIQTSEAKFYFFGGIYDEDLFREDLERVTHLYQNHGYMEIKVSSTQEYPTPKRNAMHITINVEEGPQYHTRKVEVAGNKAFQSDELLALAKLKEGGVFDKGQVEFDPLLPVEGRVDDTHALEEYYSDNGYFDVAVEPQVSIDRQNKTCDVLYNIKEGKVIYIAEVKITGNTKTKDEVIRRELNFYPGERYDGEKVENSKRRLTNLRYFNEEAVDYGVHFLRPEPTDDPDFRNLLLDVEEASTGAFNFGAGYSTEQEFTGFLELNLRNFDITSFPPFGAGQTFTGRLEAGSLGTQIDLGFTDPYFLGYPFSFGVDVFDIDREFVRNRTFQEHRTGGRLRLAKRLTETVTGNVAFQVEDVNVSDVDIDVANEIRDQLGSRTTVSTTFELVHDTRNIIFDPTQGTRESISLELAGGPLGGDSDFWKAISRKENYFPLPRKFNLRLFGEIGVVEGYGDTPEVPIFERFFAGGATTIRGYDTRDVGPRTRKNFFELRDLKDFPYFTVVYVDGDDPVGGKLRLLASAEVSYPFFKFLRGHVFFDSGAVYRQPGDLDTQDIRYSVGAGVSLRHSKIPPIRLDYGIPLNPDEEQGNGRLHFSTGLRF